jgi:hypothetical protein
MFSCGDGDAKQKCRLFYIERFLMRYLRIYIFFQIKKPFVIRQPNIQVEKSEISLKTKHCPETPNILDRRKGTSTIWRKKFTSK